MRAMVLSAGLGTRLAPLTESTPKALIPVGATCMLDIVIRRLVRAGADAVIVNVFHLADQIADFIRGRDFGARVELSRESVLLDTGGGLKQAAWFFADGRPFLLHNVDVFSDIDLADLYRTHLRGGALATLAVSERPSRRGFLFDAQGRLCGWRGDADAAPRWARGPVADARELAFNGVHAVSPEIFARMSETGAFSISRTYLRLAAEGAAVRAFRTDSRCYKDMGSPEKLEAVRAYVAANGLPD
ncbi:MAG: sugar phosphate nucleotidyltransferase [Elusimicrobia bacterium]|nr:sugar phosphate nucleotidyltransferase [Elusimicrobiota bacterium]